MPPVDGVSVPGTSTLGTIAGAVAGAIPVVGGVITGLINAGATKAANAANMQFQLNQQAAQNAYNLNLWQMQTNYNNPTNMMARYRAAGLNPNLIYGSASGNTAADIIPSVGTNYQARPVTPNVDFSQVGAQAVAAYNNTNTAIAQQKVASAQYNNLQQDTTNKLDQALLIQAQTVVQNLQASEVIPAQVKNTLADSNLKDIQATGQSILNAYSPDKLGAEISNINANTNASNAQAGLTTQQMNTVMAMRPASLQVALQEAAKLVTAQTVDKSTAAEINARVTNVLNSNTLQQLDIAQRQAGVPAGSPVYEAILGTLWDGLTGGLWRRQMTGSQGNILTPSK